MGGQAERGRSGRSLQPPSPPPLSCMTPTPPHLDGGSPSPPLMKPTPPHVDGGSSAPPLRMPTPPHLDDGPHDLGVHAGVPEEALQRPEEAAQAVQSRRDVAKDGALLDAVAVARPRIDEHAEGLQQGRGGRGR